jgi:hypothetical protein
LWLAEQMQWAGLDAERQFREACALDPFLGDAWIRLGLLAESRGDDAGAERHFLSAAAIDRQLLPRTTLANFYFRRGRAEPFWLWMRRSLQLTQQDCRPLFDLCFAMAPSPEEVYRKAIPKRRLVLRRYVEYLLGRGDLAGAGAPMADLLNQAQAEDRDVALAYCEQSLARDPEAALRIWNALCARRLVPYAPVAEGRSSLVNAEFRKVPLGRGLDWRLPAATGVETAFLPDGGIELSLDGREPQQVELISEKLFLTAGRKRLTVTYEGSGFADPSGLRWMVRDARRSGALADAPLAAAAGRSEASLAIEAAQPGLYVLSFRYARPSGSVRAAGQLRLRRIALEEGM